MLKAKIALFLLLFIGLVYLTPTFIQAASAYYISPSGNDSNSGTSPTQPWKTIARVNSTTFAPGDRILFQGGQTFAGSLYFGPSSTGTASSPIVVSSYGTGAATINAGTSYGLFAYNTAGFQISNLQLVGAGLTTNKQPGISVYSDLPNNVKLNYVHIDNVNVSGFGQAGISVASWNGTTGYNDIQITRSIAHENGQAGILMYGQGLYSHTNVLIDHCQAFNNPGITGATTNTGNGIVISSVDGGTIQRSLAHNNGSLGNGDVGIWAYDSNNITIQFNESYANHTAGTIDGGGFDLDGGVTNSIMQYNYTHGNDGAGLSLDQFSGAPNWSNNTVRYNISENDGRKNSFAGIQVYNGGSGVRNAEIYNNTVYVSTAPSGSPRAIYVQTPTTSVHFRNNILFTTGGLRMIDVSSGQTGLLLQGNDYYSGGAPFALSWYGTSYSSFSTWRSATGQEHVGTQLVGKNVRPLLKNPGAGGTIGNADLLGNLTAYQLASGSPMINAGLDLTQLFGIQVGTHDFYGNPIQASTLDIGAAEAPSTP